MWKLSILMLAFSVLACVSADQVQPEDNDGWKQAATDLPYNPLGSPMFIAPRPTDKQAIDLMCSFIQEEPCAQCNLQLPNVEQTGGDDTTPNWDRLYANRSEDVAECCQEEGNDQEVCIETLRQTTVDQYCFFVANSPMKTKLGIHDPCCEETGEARVQCMDQARYGFDVDIHDSDRTMELMKAPLLLGLIPKLKNNKKPPAYGRNFCKWAKKLPYVDTTFAEDSLQTMDLWQKKSEVTRELISCCYQNSDEPTIDKCLAEVRQKSIDDFCWQETALKEGLSLINLELPAIMKDLLKYKSDAPIHPCCKRSNTNRYSCFTQELSGYEPSRDPYDHTAEIAQYEEESRLMQTKIKTEINYDLPQACAYWTGGKATPSPGPQKEAEPLFPSELPTQERSCQKGPAGKKVAFYVAISKNFRGANSAMKYDVVMTNECDGYDTKTGCFIAPVSGTYFFTMTALRCQKSGQLYMHLMHNANIVNSMSNLDEPFESVSSSAILQLKKGDVIWVKLRIGQVYGHSPSHYTTFSGYLIFDDESD